MKIIFEKKFLKDLDGLDKDISLKLKNLIENINSYDSIFQIKNLKKLVGYKTYYRIKIGEYRLGLKIENNELVFIRFKHRKDIYKIFP